MKKIKKRNETKVKKIKYFLDFFLLLEYNNFVQKYSKISNEKGIYDG